MIRTSLLAAASLALVSTGCSTTHSHGGGASHPEHVTHVVAVAPPQAAPESSTPPDALEEFRATLPTGVAITGNQAGVESKLVAFILDAGRPVDKTTWFSFDRLTFQTGKAELDMDRSGPQVQNIAEILKAFPKVQLKLGGYTDNVGSDALNQKLSQARADNVRASIVALGIDQSRLAAEGFGQEHPVCPANDTEACRAQNRRIDVRVTAK